MRRHRRQYQSRQLDEDLFSQKRLTVGQVAKSPSNLEEGVHRRELAVRTPSPTAPHAAPGTSLV